MKIRTKKAMISAVISACIALSACGESADMPQDNVRMESRTELEYTGTPSRETQETAPPYHDMYDSGETFPVDKTTETVIQTFKVNEFDRSGSFNEGYAIVECNSIPYVIDTEGNIITKLSERSKDCKIYDGGLIVLANDNVVNINGEIIADKELMGYDEITGIWYGYIVLQKMVETLERTGYDYCILNTDGSVHLDWAANPYYSVRDTDVSAGTKELGNNFIEVTSWSHKRRRVVYNLENGKYHSTVGDDYDDYIFDGIVSYYDYGYAMITGKWGNKHIDMYDYDNILIESIYVINDPCLLEDEHDIAWIYSIKDGIIDSRSNTIVDACTRKTVTFPFNIENVAKMKIYGCNRDETLYFLMLTNNEGSIFYAIADKNGNYVIEPSTTCIYTCNDGVYTTENGIYKTDGTLIYTSDVRMNIQTFTDGYCHVLTNSGNYYVDINGNKLGVELPV